MKAFIFVALVFISFNSNAQDSVICRCSFSYSPNYPKKAEQNGICGDVLVEVNVDSACMYSNAIVKKGPGYGCDEEALRLTNIWINAVNRCHQKCAPQKCESRIVVQKITFQCRKEEE